MPVPWLASPAGWAFFWHRPLGSFDLREEVGRFQARDAQSLLPLDIFLVVGRPFELYAELAHRWRLALRRAFLDAHGDGLAVAGITRSGHYVFGPRP